MEKTYLNGAKYEAPYTEEISIRIECNFVDSGGGGSEGDENDDPE